MAYLPSPRFVAIDGAQALGHAPAADFPCDALLGGGHKWLRSGRPLAMAFAPRPGSRGLIRAIAGEMEATGELDDPLLGLARQLGERVPGAVRGDGRAVRAVLHRGGDRRGPARVGVPTSRR